MTMSGVPSVSATDAAALLDAAGEPAAGPAPLLVDVRERDEFETIRVPGAFLLPISEFAARIGELPTDRPLLVMCHLGSRSASATMFLRSQGRTDVTNVQGGIDAWERAGLPVRRGTPAPGEGELPA
jgi:rhodanese-related sulfurtransferase